MPISARRLCANAAALLALATLIGAFGTHALKPHWSAARYDILQSAVHYQFFHALGLLILGALQGMVRARSLRIAGRLLLAGVLLFSGSLYALLAGAPRLIGVLTPLGGLLMIAAWGIAAWTLWSVVDDERRADG